jgi:hypothetical protein
VPAPVVAANIRHLPFKANFARTAYNKIFIIEQKNGKCLHVPPFIITFAMLDDDEGPASPSFLYRRIHHKKKKIISYIIIS